MANEQMLPVIESYLKSQGITEDNPDFKSLMMAGSTLVGAATGALVGGDRQAAGLGANVATIATKNNYLTHPKVRALKDCLSGETCHSASDKQNMLRDSEKLSRQLDSEMRSTCSSNPTGDACRNAINSATQYAAMADAWLVMNGDVARSSSGLLDYIYNSPGAKDRFAIYYNTIDNRADFFAR